MTNIEYSHLTNADDIESSSHGFVPINENINISTDIHQLGNNKDSLSSNVVNDKAASHDNHLHGLDIDTPWLLKIRIILSQAFPIIISFFLGLGGGFVNMIYAGTYSYHGKASTVFAAVSLANMFCNITYLSLLIGMSSAVETLGSQHNGAKNYREVGIVLQRAIVVLGSLMLPVLYIWLHAGSVFEYMGIEPDVCDVIQHYVCIRTLTIPIDTLYVSYEKYLMSIGVVHPTMWDGIGFNVSIIFFNSLFVYYFKFDYQCLAWTWVISTYMKFAIQQTMSWRYEAVQRTLQRPCMEAFDKLYDFISLGLPGTIMICSEWWAYEILTIFASLIDTESVAAQAIILQVASLFFMVPMGLSIATASIVGNSLGAGKKQLAIQISSTSLGMIMVIQLVMAVFIYFGGSTFVDSFTKDALVRQISLQAMPFLAIFTWFDALQGVASGILRGAGKQSIGAIANLFSFYAIGLPMAWMICFTLGRGVGGLMMGLSVGVSVQVVVLLSLVKCGQEYVFSSSITSTSNDDITNNGSPSRLDPITRELKKAKSSMTSLLQITYKRPSPAIRIYKRFEQDDADNIELQ